MTNGEPDPGHFFDSFTLDLASGIRIRIVTGVFTATLDEVFNSGFLKTYKYVALRFYTDEDSYPRRFRLFYQLRPDLNFERKHLEKILNCLFRHSRSRERFEHEDVDDFIEMVEILLENIGAKDEDLVEHFHRLSRDDRIR
jgi:hypothetical protein